MKTVLSDLKNCGLEPFTFAGMNWPKHLWDLPRGGLRKRLADRQRGYGCGGYYHAPKPITSREDQYPRTRGFYLDSDGMPGLRWEWCDDVDGARIEGEGWFPGEGAASETIRGIVFRLPHGRGYLAGYSLGKGMSTTLDLYVWDDIVGAAHEADRMAEHAAENERLYQEQQQDEREKEEEERQHLADTTADYYAI